MTPWILIALAITALLAFNQFSAGARSNEISYTEFQTAVTDGKIDSETVVKISDSSITGAIKNDDGSTQNFTTKLPTSFHDQSVLHRLARRAQRQLPVRDAEPVARARSTACCRWSC